MTEPAVGPADSTPAPALIVQGNAIVTQQWDTGARVYREWVNGQLAVDRPFTDAENSAADQAQADAVRQATQAALFARALSDLAANQAYLDAVAAGTVTVGDAVAQVAALTRQAQGFVRLTVGGSLLDTTGN